MPDVAANVVVERRRGSLEVSFLPFVVRGGKYMKLVSFMLDVKSAPKPGVQARSTARAAVAPADRYAAHSVLATGRWAKIRVPSTGIYELTETLIRRAGFTDVSRVKVYGYGGALQEVVLSGDYLTEYDDLKEVPTCTVAAAGCSMRRDRCLGVAIRLPNGRAIRIRITAIISSPRVTASPFRSTVRLLSTRSTRLQTITTYYMKLIIIRGSREDVTSLRTTLSSWESPKAMFLYPKQGRVECAQYR